MAVDAAGCPLAKRVEDRSLAAVLVVLLSPLFAVAYAFTGVLRAGADQVRVRSRDAVDSFVPATSVAWVRAARL